MTRYVVLIGILLLALPASAQQEDKPVVQTITYDSAVTETITDDATFDWWQLQAQAGDVIVVMMSASDGLAPLLGILSPGGDLVASTLDDPAEPNAAIELEYRAEDNGMYTIVPSRVGRLEGTTSGSYTLQVRRANSSVVNTNEYQDVVFRCVDYEVTTAATVVFADDIAHADAYRITVYGLDSFQPAIRAHLGGPDITDCSSDSQAMMGDVYTFPGEEPRTITAVPAPNAAQLTIKSASQMGTITLTIASKGGSPGRYMLVIQGLTIEPRQDIDQFQFRLGPLAKTTAMQVYMIGGENSRLDPFIVAQLTEGSDDFVCDDVGRRGCPDVTPITGAGVRFNDNFNVIGDRFDAGVRLAPGTPDVIWVQFSSREHDTRGEYSLLILGELPPKAE